eukprot:1181247-Prorocentrum_minimum.AAC.3
MLHVPRYVQQAQNPKDRHVWQTLAKGPWACKLLQILEHQSQCLSKPTQQPSYQHSTNCQAHTHPRAVTLTGNFRADAMMAAR